MWWRVCELLVVIEDGGDALGSGGDDVGRSGAVEQIGVMKAFFLGVSENLMKEWRDDKEERSRLIRGSGVLLGYLYVAIQL